MPINSRRLSVLALLACGVATAAPRESPADSEAGTDYVEEVIVTAERLEKGEWPTGTIITQTYNVRRRGMLLYELGRYEEALPLLLVAAERGFKWPQAMAGDIYLHGRGGVRRDLRSGFGWLGVAASPRTSWQIDSYFRQAMAELPDHMREAAEAAVDEYRKRWDSRGWRVSCRRTASESPNSVVTSLRLNKRLRCAFYGRDTCLSPAVPRRDVRAAYRRDAACVGMRSDWQGTRGCREDPGAGRATPPRIVLLGASRPQAP